MDERDDFITGYYAGLDDARINCYLPDDYATERYRAGYEAGQASGRY